MKPIYIIFFFFTILLFYSPSAYCNTIAASPAQVSVQGGNSFDVSLVVQSDQPTYSYLLTVAYDATLITVTGVMAAGPAQASGCNLLTNLSSGQAKIGIYCASAMPAGSNPVAIVNFSTNNSTNASDINSYLNLSIAFDEIAQSNQQYPAFLDITPTTYTINASAGSGGSIFPSGPVPVILGSSQIFTISPNNGYQVNQVLLDGSPVTLTNNTYNFSNVTSAHTITASFLTGLKVVKSINNTITRVSSPPTNIINFDVPTSLTSASQPVTAPAINPVQNMISMQVNDDNQGDTDFDSPQENSDAGS